MSALQNHIRKSIARGSTMLDIGCGPANYSKRPYGGLCSKIVTVDAWAKVKPDIVADLEKESVVDLVNGDKFDFIMMMDFIEHLDREHGERIIKDAQSLCTNRIYLLTPLEAIWDDNSHNVSNPKMWSYGNEHDLHKSMWHPDDFPEEDGWHREIPLPHLKDYYFGYWQAP